jgi:hypothetical protein
MSATVKVASGRINCVRCDGAIKKDVGRRRVEGVGEKKKDLGFSRLLVVRE